MAKPLVPGVYEHPVTKALAPLLDHADRAVVEAIPPGQLSAVVSRQLDGAIRQLFAASASRDHVDLSLALSSRLSAAIAEVAADATSDLDLAPPPRRLMSIGEPMGGRPTTSLTRSTLFTRSHREPRLAAELIAEIDCADRVDLLVAFITVGGVRALRDALERLALRSTPSPRLRVLTTAFTGTTEMAALDLLARLPGAEVRISLDTRRTRLHAKAYLFHRARELSTAYVGSANLTATALGAGHEWMLKVSATDLAHVVEHFEGTFETLWQDAEFERYDPDDELQRARVTAALRAERASAVDDALTLVALRPYPFQEAILERLAAERQAGHRRNLVVAATGTGKTVVAAFDYARLAAAAGVLPRLLFLAHRQELLAQARDTFRHVVGDAAFGELVHGGAEATRADHVFATIQSSAGLLARFPADHWGHVIIDECHHIPATSYQDVLRRLRPHTLVGLTATPERTDGRSLLPDFDDRVAAELRLWHALEQQLLVPFDYYGISDGTDLRHVRWSRTGYDLGGLAELYTGDHARADLVLRQLARRVADVRQLRGLGFCVSVEHAEFMAAHATARGIPSIAVHGGTAASIRESAPRRLREREVNLVFTCDLYNEGVDLPFVDTLLLLRPTASATLFLQQLGRGLRLHEDKTACLVLDFIGQHREEFRFEAMLGALTGLPRAKLRPSVERGFPLLPSGCAVSLDAVARAQILDALRRTLGGGLRRLGGELRELSASGASLSLGEFLRETGRDASEVYTDDFGWRAVQREAGVPCDDAEAETSRCLGRLVHADDPGHLAALRYIAAGNAPTDDLGRRRALMYDAQVRARGVLRAAEATAVDLAARPRLAAELVELTEHLASAATPRPDVWPEPDWPLALHRCYQRREIVTAVGERRAGDKISVPQGGILKLDDSRRELLFVTLDKSGGEFTATTRYRDYAISRDLFHWETQGVASVDSAAGRRYLDSPANGWRFFLFVRFDRDAPYTFLGPATYLQHAGDRPIGITWRLTHPIAPDLLERFLVLGQS
ncbi:MAG: DUF3427 domain-containing protein [Kofleriaceae bacterium]